MKLDKKAANRVLIYFFHDEDGIVDDYVLYALKELKSCVKDIYVVANGTLTAEGREKLTLVTDSIWERENKGFAMEAYQYSFDQIGWEKLCSYDELVLIDSELMGPVYPVEEMFTSMEDKDLDFWGLSEFYRNTSTINDLEEEENIQRYVQCHFLSFRNTILVSNDFKDYWNTVPEIHNYEESVAYFETTLTEHFEKQGYRWGVYAHWDGLEDCSYQPLLKIPAELLAKKKCPFFMRQSFINDYSELLHETYGENSVQLMEYLKTKTDYNVDLIWDHILRIGNIADIKNCLNLNYVVAEQKSEDISEILRTKKVALIYHFYYEHLLDECVHYVKSMPEGTDIYITTDSEEKKCRLQKAFQNLPYQMEIRLVESIGRDVSALLVGAKDIIFAYDYVCFAHDEQSQLFDPQLQGMSWTYKCISNILKNQHQVRNIIRLFEENSRLGLLCPSTPNHACFHSLLGKEWMDNFENVKKMALQLDLKIKLNPEKEPVAPIGNMFWFRTKALYKLFKYEWEYKDFSQGGVENDSTISHTIERVYGLVSQDAGYYPAWVFSEEGAAVELTNLTYMLREMNKVIFYNKIEGGNYTAVCHKMTEILENRQELSGIFPVSLYLDKGDGYRENHVIRKEPIIGKSGYLDVFFEWDIRNMPLKVRFDPGETGGICLEDVCLELLLPYKRKQKIALERCIDNGIHDGNILVFKNADPWIDISLSEYPKARGLKVSLKVSRAIE
ncbi:rhamnan synthesis F family protein [Fusibacillus kribbianus]|uniref:Rhamnan synthesis F family protein n=1 Tax=Fusibacillus kribbianus TaxID=3044208 RepID=A0AAP4BCY5_9FIRM|nr:rhamnan synthesis F family protein [Ruminococcus sp. YH-rum2234]MDI9242903.1 rhamnan synthesis F family protein [Ruminococcus sp. YH-rum2234]